MGITPKPRGNIVDYYEDNKNRILSKNDSNKWISLLIVNDSTTNDLTIKVNDIIMTIKANESFDEDFEDFNFVEIKAVDYYRVWLRE